MRKLLVFLMLALSLLLVAQEVIKIGAIFPLTGPAAATGTKIKYAVEVAQEIINGLYPDIDLPLAKTAGLSNLGGAKVQFIFADHQANPELAMAEAERLITREKVVALIGCYHSSATKPASQSAEKYGIPFVAGSSSSAALTERGLKWFFRIAPHDGLETDFFFEYLRYLNEKYNANVKRVAVVYIDNEYGVHAAQMVKEKIKNYPEFTLVADVKYPAGATNIDIEVQKVRVAKPDVVFHASYIGDMTMFAKKYKEFNVAPKVVLSYCGGYHDPQFVINLGKDADFFSGGAATTPVLIPRLPVLAKINEMYKAKSGVDIDGPTLEDFASALVIAEAINIAGSTEPAKILEVLRNHTFAAPYVLSGKIKFGPDGQNIYNPNVMTQIINGIYEVVWPEEFRTKDPVVPMPEWSKR